MYVPLLFLRNTLFNTRKKWNEDQITVKEVLKAIERQPLFGHTTGRDGKTMWMCFMKLPINEQ
nr:MAG TPA: hypothetical protein [Caudoviricetes sp.]